MRFLISFLLFASFSTFDAQITGSSCYTYYKESGQCVSVRKCKTIWKLILEAPRPLPERLTEYIRNSQCGNPQDQSICCRPQDIEGNEPVNPQPSVNRNTGSNGISNHRNLRLLDLVNCGSATGDRISNGNQTSLFEFPWSALLGYENTFGDVEYRCGGTLITSKTVLTAAHCIRDGHQSRLTTVRLGEYDTSTQQDCQSNARDSVCAPPVQEIPIRSTLIHPDYDKNRYLNDIALVRLQYSADTSDFAVKTICLPITQQLLRSNPQSFVVTGWGATEQGRKSDVLLKAKVSLHPHDRCQEAISRLSKRVQITEAHLCAVGVGNNVDTCSGDSGGPIQVAANFNNDVRIVQYGIISFGPNSCGNSGTYPGVYTNLRHFLTWVLDNIS
ncbi:serine protease grass-like [Culicoides brevitarsis]|uniref:serine protease grass-like n=1 Tax=Culicoides brevitarsis TaxID=469753 RepID=UPI00307CBF61